MRRMVQAAPSVTLHMPEATSALRSVRTRPLNFDIMLPLVLVAVDPAVQQLARDGRLGPSESFCHVRHVVSAAEHELDAE